ncbi:hypothetical protein B7463_g12679, partial [Scytalidium lignicola]
MNQDLETDTPVDNNNKQQLEEGSEEGFEEESEEGSEEVSEESSEDSSEEDQDKNQTIEETNIQREVLEEIVMPPKQTTRSTKGSTVGESSRAARKKPTPPLPKPNPKPVPKPRTPSLDLDLDSELEDNVEQVLITTFREVKIARPDLFYGDKKKLKVYLVQTRTYLVLNDYLLLGNMHKVLIRLKDFIKKELYQRPTINKLNALIDLAIKIGNEQYKMILDKKGKSYFNRRKSNGKKDCGDLMELDVMKKGRTFKGKGKKHFEGRSKKGNSFRISSEELDKRRKNKLCFKCKLPEYMANTHKKDNKSSVTVKVGVMRILRIMDILSESSDEEGLSKEDNSSEEGDYQDLVTVLHYVIKINADNIMITRILKMDSIPIERIRHYREIWGLGKSVEQLPEAEQYYTQQERRELVEIVVE